MMRALIFFLIAWCGSTTTAAQTLFVPPVTWAMQFAQNGAGSISPLTQLIGTRAMAWATAPVAGVGNSFYIPCCRDPLSTTGSATVSNPHNLQWFYDHHPDWLVYPNSGTSVPSTGGSGNLWGINIHLQEVLDYMIAYARDPTTVGAPVPAMRCSTLLGVLCGYAYLAVDNIAAYNANSVEGYYAGATPGCGSAPSFCGVWTQIYTGADIDQAWADDIYRLANQLRSNLSRVGVGTWLNAKLNHSDVSRSNKLALSGSALLRESPYLHACNSAIDSTISTITWSAGTVTVNTVAAHGLSSGYVVGVWGNSPAGYNTPTAAVTVVNSTRFTYPLVSNPGTIVTKGFVGNTDFVDGRISGTDWYALLQQAVAVNPYQIVVHFNYLCDHVMTDATRPEIAYTTANYYLVRQKYTYFEMQNGGGGTRDSGTLTTYPAPFLVDLGEPVDAIPTAGSPNSGGGCYKRAYTKGMVVVWPDIVGSCTYTIPSDGHVWQDQFGTVYSAGSNTLLPDTSVTPNRANAVVLVRQ